MPQITIRNFRGQAPKIDDQLLSDNMATLAQDCDVTTGAILPVSQAKPLPNTLSPESKTLYRYPAEASIDDVDNVRPTEWFTWPGITRLVETARQDDAYQRLYIAGDDGPQVMGHRHLMDAESSYTQRDTFRLGVPKPERAPVAQVIERDLGQWRREWHYYYETASGERYDEGDLAEGHSTDIREQNVGRYYKLLAIPPRRYAPQDATLVLWFNAFDNEGNLLGTLYPEGTASELHSDAYFFGAKLNAKQINSDQNGETTASFQILYDSTNQDNYTLSRAYVYTWVTHYEEEGPPSPPSDVLDVASDQAVRLRAFSPPPTDRNIKAVRIYRTVSTNDGTYFRYVNEIALNLTSYDDLKAEGDTAERLPSEIWDEPPEDLRGIAKTAGGFLVGFRQNQIYFSEVNQEHAWPAEYMLELPYRVVGLAVQDNVVVACTTGLPYTLTGTKPSEMTTLKLSAQQPALSEQGIVDLGSNGVGFVSSDGFVIVRAGEAKVVSSSLYTREQWRALNPKTINAAYHDGQLYLFCDEKTLIADLNETPVALTESRHLVDAAWSALDNQSLFVIRQGALSIWRDVDGVKNESWRWRSKRWEFQRDVTFNAYYISADQPVTLRLFADGAEVFSSLVSVNNANRLPCLPRARHWQLELTGNDELRAVTLGHSLRDMYALA